MSEELHPLTIKAALRSLGVPLGGAVRAKWARGIDDALFGFWSRAVERVGGEDAAIMTFALVSLDPTFRHPLWLRNRLRAHRAAVLTAVENGTVRRVRGVLEQRELWG